MTNNQPTSKIQLFLYKKILSKLMKENKFHKNMFSIEALEKVASKRTLEKNERIMSTLQNEVSLETIAESLREELPSLSEEEVQKLAHQIFQEKSQ